MAYLDKEAYERRAAYAERKLSKEEPSLMYATT